MQRTIAKVLVFVAILIIFVPFLLEYVFHKNPVYFFRNFGISYFLEQFWFYASGVLLLVAAMLQFPISEEEAWHCDCGYDLSYMNKTSKHCPECGAKVALEWTPSPGELPRKTKRRLAWVVVLTFAAVFVIGFGLIIKTVNRWASV